MLACYAGGSMLSGIAFGSLRGRRRRAASMLLGAAAMTATGGGAAVRVVDLACWPCCGAGRPWASRRP
jgi:hypothetical protein